MKNIMSVDLEDYFCDLPINEWIKYESRIIDTTQILLDLFEKYNVKATFFSLGYVGKHFPSLIKKIHDLGHEIGSHGYSHIDLRNTSKEEFENDLLKSTSILEKITGEPILGFRAPFFSINHSNYWVFEILKKYLKYDSSIFPVKTPLYGLPEAPKEIYHPSSKDILQNDDNEEFIEIPLTTYQILPFVTLPIAGGFHFRFFPLFIIKNGIRKSMSKQNPAMFYIHPKDLDSSMPKIEGYGWHYYYGKNGIKRKFEGLLKEFNFTNAKEILNL